MLFIINPISGKGKKQKLAKRLLAKGYKVAFTEYAGHAEMLAREATDEVVVAVGGDGTVNEVARGIVGTEKALQTIEQGECKRMDTAEINGRPFFSVCGVGFDAVVSERFANHGKRGLANYIKLGLDTLRSYKPESYSVEIDGERIETKALIITIGNSDQWGNNAKIAPLADCCDGILDITIVEKFSVLEMPILALRLMTGTLQRSRKVHCYKGKSIRITRQSEGVAHADGDWFMESATLNIKILPSTLKVIA